MKVLSVTFGKKKSFNNPLQENHNSAFLYTPIIDQKVKEDNGKKFKFLLGALALLAVSLTLLKMKGRKKLPESIAEVTNPEKGLNKLKGLDRTTEELKSKIVYPIKAVILGDKSSKKDLKSGLILADKNTVQMDEILCALNEHFEELGVKTVKIPKEIKRTKETGEVVTKKIKKNLINKLLFSYIKEAEKSYKENGTHTVINLGNLSDYTDLRVMKSQISNFEEILQNKTAGIIWTGWTNRTHSLPLFLSDLPVLITKILD